MKVVFTYDYGKEKMAGIEALGYQIEYAFEGKTPEETLENFKKVSNDFEVLVCYNPFDAINLKDYPSLKWIQLSSIGIDQVPKDSVKALAIEITNNRGGYSIPMGEWIVYKILHAYKFGKILADQQSEKRWKVQTKVRELTHRKVMFLGTGTIASEAVKRLEGFNMCIIGVNTQGRPVDGFDEIIASKDFESRVSEADFLVVSIPHTPDTEQMVSDKILSLMKEDAVIINIARGAIIDEQALIKHLEQGKFLSVSLDVFENEPLDPNSPLWTLANVDVSPHNSWISEYRNDRRFDIIYDNLKAYRENKPLKNRVDVEKGY